MGASAHARQGTPSSALAHSALKILPICLSLSG
jgi:hypothetical protein